MPSSNENTSNTTPSAAPGVTTVAVGDKITAQKMQDMVTVLENLLNHTHVFYDDYGTACNCNCNCNCTRGSL